MKMRTLFILLCCSVSLISCKDSKKEKDDLSDTNNSIEHENDLGSYSQDQPIAEYDANSHEESESSKAEIKEAETASNSISGTYLNIEHSEDASCKCYCIEVSTGGSSELCLKENELYINARFQQKGNNIDIYFSGKSSKTNNKEIPWDKFETGTPIAILSPGPYGDLKLDWKGFRIDGEIAIEYALLGKKTLEGTYKKK